jgi:hypothetical protein
MRMTTRRAKLFFYIGGYLTKIKTPQRFHRVVSWEPFQTKHEHWQWFDCVLSQRMVGKAMRDPHFDHWGLQHSDEHCVNRRPCPDPVCGGELCDDRDGDVHALA